MVRLQSIVINNIRINLEKDKSDDLIHKLKESNINYEVICSDDLCYITMKSISFCYIKVKSVNTDTVQEDIVDILITFDKVEPNQIILETVDGQVQDIMDKFIMLKALYGMEISESNHILELKEYDNFMIKLSKNGILLDYLR